MSYYELHDLLNGEIIKFIKWKKCCSNYFTIFNDVRPGGTLSPKLFTLYMKQLTDKLIACNACCYFNSMRINHVMYAGDVCLIAPIASAIFIGCML